MAVSALEALRTIQRELDTRRTESVPSGWITAQEWADEAGITVCNVQPTLNKAVRAGTLQMKKFRVQTPNGVRSVMHYLAPWAKKSTKRK
jgi:hypothetical protein